MHDDSTEDVPDGIDGRRDAVVTLAMATREDDPQWSDLVRSMTSSTIHAEIVGITSMTANTMPVLELFGPSYLQAFRDVILAIGNYKEIYERNMESHIPRVNNTRNNLNSGLNPMFYANWRFHITDGETRQLKNK